MTKNKSIAIITARGGSKRIPNKNIKIFCGKPILAYSIEAAIESNIFSEVMVSTDSNEIANIAKKHGAKVPFMRSKMASGDFATTTDVIMEVLEKYKENGQEFSEFCCIYPTAPFLTPERLKKGMSLLDNADSVLPVVRFSFPPQRCVIIKDGHIQMKWPENINTRSQDLEPFYHDCGQFYCCKTDAFINEKKLILKNTVPYIIDEREVQDIDNIEDWEIAELKYQLIQKKRKAKGL